MGIKKYLTCKTYLEATERTTIVARLDSGDGVNKVITEPGDIYTTDGPFGVKVTCIQMPDKHYLAGEIAERLYEYEQLGYTPEELKEIIRRYQAYRFAVNSIYGKTSDLDVAHLYPKQIYITTGRQNGKTEIQRQMYEYMLNDYLITKRLAEWPKNNPYIPDSKTPEIKNVIFNDPATIVFWADGTKTVVKAQNEEFDPEKGLAMAITKKVFGNKPNYFNKIKKWTGKYEAPKKLDVEKLLNSKCVTVTVPDKDLPWRIWMTYLDADGHIVGRGVYPRDYARKASAVRRAKQLWGDGDNVIWVVSQTNPWANEANN